MLNTKNCRKICFKKVTTFTCNTVIFYSCVLYCTVSKEPIFTCPCRAFSTWCMGPSPTVHASLCQKIYFLCPLLPPSSSYCVLFAIRIVRRPCTKSAILECVCAAGRKVWHAASCAYLRLGNCFTFFVVVVHSSAVRDLGYLENVQWYTGTVVLSQVYICIIINDYRIFFVILFV